MRQPIHCQFEYRASMHLSQLYAGFEQLQKKGLIQIELRKEQQPVHPNLLHVTVNHQYKVLYDVSDGFNWINGTEHENLEWFQTQLNANYIFKRSFQKRLEQYAPAGCKVLPLGFNYPVTVKGYHWKNQLRYLLHGLPLMKNVPVIYNASVYADQFEGKPVLHEKQKVLFITRLWNPASAKTNYHREQREELNKTRVQLFKQLKAALGNDFTGGVIADEFSKQYCSDALLPAALTKRSHYITVLKSCSICVSTTGLHASIPWKLGEYVAASKAILTEPLQYEVPGNFSENKNYRVYQTPEELLSQILFLRQNPETVVNMMKANQLYYQHYLQPGQLIENTLHTIVNH